MLGLETYLISAGILLILCVLASKATGKLGIPSLVVFLAVGMIAGSEGIGGIHFDNARLAQSVGVTALAYILFSGGLDTKWEAIRPVMKEGIILSSLGVFFTCLLMTVFIHLFLEYSWDQSFLIGAIISSTDAGAVFTVLRSKNVYLKTRLKSLLELESGSNDPMAVFLTTTILQYMFNPNLRFYEMLMLLTQQLVIGALMGFFSGKVLIWLFRGLRLDIEGLYLVLSIAVVMLVYSLTEALRGNGFLAVYIAGVVLGNNNFFFKKSLSIMHDGISWLMQSAMFLTLGLLVYPNQLIQVSQQGIFLAFFMIILARPITVFGTLAFSGFSWREKTLISWVGLRGSVPVVLATYPLVANITNATFIFNLIFFVALTSLIVQGTTVSFFSRLLKVNEPGQKKRAYPSTPGHLKDIVTVDVPKNSILVGKTILDLNIPHERVLFVAIERAGEVIIPKGSTTLEANDKVSLMADDDALEEFVVMLWTFISPTEKRPAQEDILLQ